MSLASPAYAPGVQVSGSLGGEEMRLRHFQKRAEIRSSGPQTFLTSMHSRLADACSFSAGETDQGNLRQLLAASRQAHWQARNFCSDATADYQVLSSGVCSLGRQQLETLKQVLGAQQEDAERLCELFLGLQESLSDELRRLSAAEATQRAAEAKAAAAVVCEAPRAADPESTGATSAVQSLAASLCPGQVVLARYGESESFYWARLLKVYCHASEDCCDVAWLRAASPGGRRYVCHDGLDDSVNTERLTIGTHVRQPCDADLADLGEGQPQVLTFPKPTATGRFSSMNEHCLAVFCCYVPRAELFVLRTTSRHWLVTTASAVEAHVESLLAAQAEQSRSRSSSRVLCPQCERRTPEENFCEYCGHQLPSLTAQAPEAPPSESSALPPVPVLLHIYDVTNSPSVQWINAVFANPYSPFKFGGLFHIGVQVGVKEWAFGFKPQGSGVYWTPPFSHDQHHWRESIVLEAVCLKEETIDAILSELEEEFAGRSYNLFRRNCCHFADELCQRLGAGRVPEWTYRLAVIGGRAAEAVKAIDHQGTMTHMSRSSAAPVAPALTDKREDVQREKKEQHEGSGEQQSCAEKEPQTSRARGNSLAGVSGQGGL
eukprot:TRINITY_DN81416_c0_g1_i1.p1 TRINITY_DN81416_c0_g1~~TRINITY_DN81416_c0_g1_i1.p1  ORF type:complete len:611 (-),score=127.74 TRINITY_DN81416_c0_g1_i1:11-1822(-)